MIKYYKTENGKLTTLSTPEKDCWINIYPPFNHEHIRQLSEQHNIPLDFLIDSTDIDERSRFQREDGIDLIVLKTPIVNEEQNERDAIFITIPIGIIILPESIITISPFENPVIDAFLNNNVKGFNTTDRRSFVLQIFDRSTFYFTYYLKETNNERNQYEKILYKSMRNEELLKLLTIEKSLVYFVTSLRSNELLMLKSKRINYLNIGKDDEELNELYEDILVDTGQALEMANVYTNILSGTMDAFASIINNNMNIVIKRLTSITIILSLPVIVTSVYGMNLPIPLEKSEHAFYYVLGICFALCVLAIWYFWKKRWF